MRSLYNHQTLNSSVKRHNLHRGICSARSCGVTFINIYYPKCNKSQLPGCNNLILITWGCNNVCRITWVCNIDFSKWRQKILHEIEYFAFHNYFVFFLKRKSFFFSFEIHVFRSDQFSLLMYRCLPPSSATVKMDYEVYMETARYATNDDTPL